jgi:hypothetical protein
VSRDRPPRPAARDDREQDRSRPAGAARCGRRRRGNPIVAAGDNPERLSNEASFAALCGASPVDASSGRQHRHRFNRGGNRDANRGLWVVALVRLRCDPRTRIYVERRTAQGLAKPEILRCLKRYIARDVFKILRAPANPNGLQKRLTEDRSINAVAESFFSTLEFERPSTSTWRYVVDGEHELFTFVEGYYTQTRLHSHNAYRTPNESEAELRNGARSA